MTREHKKKPGDMARARARHLRRAEISRALSQIHNEAGDPVRLRLHDAPGLGACEWDLTPLADEWDYMLPCAFLVRFGGKRLEICLVVDKDGFKAYAYSNGSVRYVHGPRELLALATPANDAAKAWA